MDAFGALDTLEGVIRAQTLTRRRRMAGAWFPLAVFALVLIGADLVRRLPPHVANLRVNGGIRVDGQNRLANIVGAPASLPLAVYWIVAMPLSFVVCAAWSRWRANRSGVDQRWLVAAAVALVPFGLLLALRLVIEPAIPPIDHFMSYGTRRAWTQPVACYLAGMVAWAVVSRSRWLVWSCGAVAGANAAWWLLNSSGARYDSRRRDVLLAVDDGLRATGLSVLGVGGVILLALAIAWPVASHRSRRG